MKSKMLARSIGAALAVSLIASACAGDEESAVTTAADTGDTTGTTTGLPADTEPEATDTTVAEAEVGNIVEVAQGNDDFSILVEAVVAADLVEDLSADGELTVFAPTNDAFEAFLTENDTTKDELLAREDLADILLFHVLGVEVDGAAATTAAEGAESVATLQGGELALSLDGDAIKVGEATVVTADDEASNGVIHAIDTVLIPA